MSASRPAEWDEPQFCRDCGVLCPRARWCYAIPTCYDCLPAPKLARMKLQHNGSTKGEGER